MDPIRQTVFTDPKSGKLGNCFNACLASLLELKLGEVPRFHLMKGNQTKRLKEFLGKHGYVFHGFVNGSPTGKGVDGFFIASYEVVNHPPYRHCVIWKDGSIFHDPRDHFVELGCDAHHYLDIERKQ